MNKLKQFLEKQNKVKMVNALMGRKDYAKDYLKSPANERFNLYKYWPKSYWRVMIAQEMSKSTPKVGRLK